MVFLLLNTVQSIQVILLFLLLLDWHSLITPAVLVRVLLLWTDTMTKASLIKKQQLNGAGLQIQRFSPLSSRWEHGGIQAVMVQAELRVLCLHPTAASGRLPSRHIAWEYYAHTQRDTHTPNRSYLFQQGHTSKWCHSVVQEYTDHYNIALKNVFPVNINDSIMATRPGGKGVANVSVKW